MKRITIKFFQWLILIFSISCVEPFDPPVQDAEVNFLVVDSYLNTTTGHASVKLSRASVLHEVTATLPELAANVSIEDNSGNTYPLNELGLGAYELIDAGLTVLSRQYRIYIRSSDGKEHRSAFVTPTITPPIDSVNWVPKADGVQIVVDTHDETAQSRYYRWDFVETWEYKAPLSSDFKLVNGAPKYREPEEQIYVCYRSLPSTPINTTSTVRLSEDRVSDYELTFLPRGTQKLSVRYSVLVKQYALSRTAFDYWEQLKNTTESLGGLFDPQPGKVSGNISNINDPDDIVLGFFDAGSIQEKRIFIRFVDLPSHLKSSIGSAECIEESIGVAEVATLPSFYLITSQITQGIVVVGYRYTTIPCADCRYQGGSVVKPDFW
jgi:hypothetical protein